MAKKKNTKKQKNNELIENEVLVYIYSLIAITLCIIGMLEIGFVGVFMTNVLRYVFGNLYVIVYTLVIIYALVYLFKKNIKEINLKYVIALGCIFLGWLLLVSEPEADMIGFEVWEDYLARSEAIFQQLSPAQGGLIGAFVYSLFSMAFDRLGTLIFSIVLFLIAILILFDKKLFSGIGKINSYGKKTVASQKERMEERKLRKLEEAEEEKKPFHIEIDDTETRKSTIQFLNADEDVIEEDVVEEIVLPQSVKEETVEEVQTVVEDTSKFVEDYSKYKLPRLSLLKDNGRKNRSSLNQNAANDAGKQLISILEQFGVNATLIATHIGPSVTKFEIKPELGVRVNKISNLQNDIKMALSAKDIRIEAPIPGKSAVGIEIPNVEKTSVSMKELMRNVPAGCEHKKLLFALGKDLLGNGIYGELNKMPHLLIAGATGSGKSVCVNAIITSILMRTKPDEVKMLLIDPKKVEFTPYHNIPHLLGPVITDGEEASRALKVVVNMMDQRYELFSMASVRNIDGYNAYVRTHSEEGLKPMPWIVVIIDELADLMLVAAKEVESSIQRITQLARAAGIHLIVATQRPSVDVITGVIKANIPSRIAFAVSSAVDSRTILDQVGAERLLGCGDMLYIPIGEQVATRVQGVFVSDEEVNEICEFVSSQARPRFDDAFIRLETFENGQLNTDTFNDPLYEEVKEFVISSRKASTSFIQRKFAIGYARAARLIDVLEERGIIGPSRGSKPREVYAKEITIDEPEGE